MLYEETEKKEIERVYAVFADYIWESPYLEWLWSDKLGYLLLKISTKKRYVEEEILVDTADQLAEVLFSEVSMDVFADDWQQSHRTDRRSSGTGRDKAALDPLP